MKKANIVGIIPARGGSKGVPKKNIKEIGGFPMIAYSVVAGQSTVVRSACVWEKRRCINGWNGHGSIHGSHGCLHGNQTISEKRCF